MSAPKANPGDVETEGEPTGSLAYFSFFREKEPSHHELIAAQIDGHEVSAPWNIAISRFRGIEKAISFLKERHRLLQLQKFV